MRFETAIFVLSNSAAATAVAYGVTARNPQES